MDAVSVMITAFFSFIAIAVIFFIAALIVRAVKSLNNRPQPHQNSQQSYSTSSNDTYRQLKRDSNEDSEGDGMILFDDPMFPPEFNDEEDDFE